MGPKLILLLLLLFAGYAHTVATDSPSSDAKRITIEMRDYDFQPQKITIDSGTTVEWINVGKHVHTVTDANSA